MNLIEKFENWLDSFDEHNPKNYEYRIEVVTERSGKKWYVPQVKFKYEFIKPWKNILGGYAENGIIEFLNPYTSHSGSESYQDEDKAKFVIGTFQKKLNERWMKEKVNYEYVKVK